MILTMDVGNTNIKTALFNGRDLSGWKVIVGGSALPGGLAMLALDRGVDAFGAWGMSETGPILTLAQIETAALDDEDRANRLRGARAGLEHAVGLRDLHLQVLDHREVDLDALHVLVLDLFLDRAQPRDVRVDAVDREPEQLAVALLELRLHRGEGHELRRADRREVRRVREEHDPLPLETLGEIDLPLRGLGLERRGLLADQRQTNWFLIIHLPSPFLWLPQSFSSDVRSHIRLGLDARRRWLAFPIPPVHRR